MNKGIFISLEGGEGVGKTQCAKALQNHFGDDCVLVRDPSPATPELAMLRKLLTSKEYKLSKISELILYISSRGTLVDQFVRPALEEGKIVISDRFDVSTLVYQGILRGFDFETIEYLNNLVCGDVRPELTLVYNVDAKVGLSRSLSRQEAQNISETKWEEMGLEVHKKINQGFIDIQDHIDDRLFLNFDSTNNGLEDLIKQTISCVEDYVDNCRMFDNGELF